MEPARDEREYEATGVPPGVAASSPQWSPLGMSGNTRNTVTVPPGGGGPQWSPLGMSGNTCEDPGAAPRGDAGRNGARSG